MANIIVRRNTEYLRNVVDTRHTARRIHIAHSEQRCTTVCSKTNIVNASDTMSEQKLASIKLEL